MGWLNNLLGFLKVHEDKTTGIHGVGASTIDSASARDSAIATHEADTSTHGVTQIDGVTERNSAISTHEAKVASAHTLQSDGSELISTSNKPQFRGRGAAGIGGCILYEAGGSVYYGTNCEYDSPYWNRVDTTKQAWLLQISSTGVQYIYGASAGANPIATWDLATSIPVLKSHRDENVSSTVHPNAISQKAVPTPTNSGWTDPAYAYDGNLATAATVSGQDATLTFDLGALKDVTIYALGQTSDAGGGSDNQMYMSIQVSSDGSTWVGIGESWGRNSGVTWRNCTVYTRYFRVFADYVYVAGGGTNANLYEVRVIY